VPDNDYATIGRLLDRGALSIIVPMVNSPEEAQRAARAVRYPPRGSRSGGGPTGYLTYGGDYATSADDEVLLMVQIETLPAAQAAAEILSVDGVDGCMIGPSDLSRSMGLDLSQPADRERHAQAIREIRDACVRVGKLPGIATGGRGAEQYLKEGFLFVLALGDYGLIAEGGRDALQWINEVRSALS
jgi:4-hydroxy-2-oxoheptanedioate aldolase